jgi:acetyltransferase EpsM
MKLVIIGCGSHADVVHSIASECGYTDIHRTPYENVTNCINTYYVIAVGNNQLRKKIALKYPYLSYIPALVSPNAYVHSSVSIGNGTVIAPGSVVQVGANIDAHCIINTRASVDHHSVVGVFSHICPGVTVCGNAVIGDSVMVGPGAVVCNNVYIVKNTTIGALSLVNNNVLTPGIYFGTPAKMQNRVDDESNIVMS